MTSSADPLIGLAVLVGAIALAIFVGVSGAIVVFTVRYRDRGPTAADPAGVPQIHGNQRLELLWTAAPLVVLAIVFAASLQTLAQVGRSATFGSNEAPVVIRATGQQWWFDFAYADGWSVPNEVHIPVGVPVEFRVTSRDVIHDLWIPELGVKTDIIPGRENILRVYTTRAGTYDGVCAEFCGLEHAWMRFRVVAEPRPAYDRWIAGQAAARSAPAGLAAQGEQVFLGNVCVACHAIRGTAAAAHVGPELTHLASRAKLAGGVLPNDPVALRAWLADPQRYKPGSFMPQITLSATDLTALVAYLAGLR